MWALMHLASASVLYKNEIKGFVEVMQETNYFYKDLNSGSIRYQACPMERSMKSCRIMKKRVGSGQMVEFLRDEEWIELQRCEFEILEVS